MLHVPRMQQNSRSSPFVVKVLMLFQYMSTYAESSEWWVQMSADVFPCSADDGPLLAHWPQWPSQVYDLRGLQNHWKQKPPLKRFAGWATVLVPPSYPRSCRPGDGGEPPGAGEALWLQWHSFGPMSQALKARLKLFSMISMMFHVRFSAVFFDKTLWWEMPGWNFRSQAEMRNEIA